MYMYMYVYIYILWEDSQTDPEGDVVRVPRKHS